MIMNEHSTFYKIRIPKFLKTNFRFGDFLGEKTEGVYFYPKKIAEEMAKEFKGKIEEYIQ